MTNQDNGLVSAYGIGSLSALDKSLSAEEKAAIIEADSKLAISMLPMVQSKDVVGQRLNILDAVESELQDGDELKDVVVFVCENEKQEIFTVTKSANRFNLAYVAPFAARRGKVEGFSLRDMMFVEDANYGTRANAAIVLRRYEAPKKEKAVN